MKYINVIKKITRDKGRKMLDKYKELNDEAKKYLLEELYEITNDREALKRCEKEIDLLYENAYLFMIEYLYIFKHDNFYTVDYQFNGLEDQLLLLYTLGLSKTKPLNNDLSKLNIVEFHVSFRGVLPTEFINTIHVCNGGEFKLFKGSFNKTNNEEENNNLDNHYIIIPSYALPYNITFKYDINEPPEIDILSTVEDYRNYKEDYLMVKLT